MKARDFMELQRLSFKAQKAEKNPDMSDPDFEGDHWYCVFSQHIPWKERTFFSLHFSQGYGHGGKKPSAINVLECLSSDFSSVDCARNFEDWASDLGWDPDSRRAKVCYDTIQHQRTAWAQAFGADSAHRLMTVREDD